MVQHAARRLEISAAVRTNAVGLGLREREIEGIIRGLTFSRPGATPGRTVDDASGNHTLHIGGSR